LFDKDNCVFGAKFHYKEEEITRYKAEKAEKEAAEEAEKAEKGQKEGEEEDN